MPTQIALIVRWNSKVIDLGVRLLALSCFDGNRFVKGRNAIEDDINSFHSLDPEFTAEVIDLLHEYCFTLRKLIERTENVESAKKLNLHDEDASVTVDQGGVEERDVVLCKENLWWVLGRVIHSKSVTIIGGDRANLVVYRDTKTREYSDGRCYVEVSSDLDSMNESHVVHVPSLVRVVNFSPLAQSIQKFVRENTVEIGV